MWIQSALLERHGFRHAFTDRTGGVNCRDCEPSTYGISAGSGMHRLEVDNCEMAGFSLAAISLSASSGHAVHHNYLHHTQRQGLGYGVVLGGTSLLGGQGGYGFTVIGVLVLQVLSSFLIGIGLDFEWQQFIFGLLILPMVALYARSPHIRTQI